MKKQPIFTLSNGDLSAYSFACGYVQKEFYKGAEIQLYMEHSHFHVRAITIQKCTPYKVWDTFYTLKEARKRFSELKKEAKSYYK